MKHLNLILIFVIAFFASTGCMTQASFVAPPPTPDPYRRSFVPVTWEIVSEIVNQNPAVRNFEFEDLNYFLSGTINLIANTHDRSLEARDGRLVINARSAAIEKRMTSLDRGTGRFINYPAGSESFEVVFPESTNANLSFIFVRNQERNIFELTSIRDPSSGTSYSLQYGGTAPYLFIFLDYRGAAITTVLQNLSIVIPDRADVNSVGIINYPIETAQPQIARQENFYGLPGTSREIIGRGILHKDGITSFIVAQGSTMSNRNIEEIVSIYIEEALREGINHDIAIAQMITATLFLSKPGILFTHNYGALRKMDNREVRFANMREGIRAHIQQLKAHASLEDPVEQIVDMLRFETVRADINRQFPRTFDELFPVWKKENPTLLRHDINIILAGIYFHQQRIL